MDEHNRNAIQMRSRLKVEPCNAQQRTCHHPTILVVEETRLLHCERCGLWIEPFDFFLRWASRHWAAENRLAEYERKAKDLVERISHYKHEETLVRQRVRVWRKKLVKIESKGD